MICELKSSIAEQSTIGLKFADYWAYSNLIVWPFWVLVLDVDQNLGKYCSYKGIKDSNETSNYVWSHCIP